MSYVSSGPVSSMPGSIHTPPALQMCDSHPTEFAVHRVQGETDSMGAEYHDMCRSCYDKFKASVAASAEEDTTCDWCLAVTKDCRPTRDYDEGSSGRIYTVCGACRSCQSREALAELEENDEWYGD